MEGNSENIKVVVRCRPVSQNELSLRCKAIVEADSASNMVTVTPPEKAPIQGDGSNKSFTFDHVFPAESTQAQVYDAVTRPIVQNVLEGYNGTIFAYGQTGTGKTFTMEGFHDNPDLKGIIPNSFAQIFSCVDSAENQRFLVRCSYLEIYNENIRDLLCEDQTKFLELKENKDKEVYVKDLTSMVVCDTEDMDRLMSKGNKNRSVAFTNMNADSSRSHAIFSIVVECSTDSGPSKGSLRMGKLNLVDLAGSERLSKTQATGDRLKEATKINLSLSNLGNVISALVDGSSYIPYRNSKLTRLLQDSLGGNSKTVMVATIGPADFNYEETISTLRYANRAKNIRNCAKINEDPKDAVLRRYQEEIFHLRNLLEQKKHALKEQEQQQQSQRKKISTPVKKKRNSGIKPVVELDEEIGTLLKEQKIIEKKHRDELKALLEPYGINADGSSKEIMEELERRKSALRNDGELMKEENERLLEELQQATDAMINSKRQCKTLFHRVISLESQLQQSQMKDEELRVKEKELAEQHLREESFRKALELKKLTSIDLKEELSKLQGEIEEKRKKSARLSSKISDHKEQMMRLKYSHVDHLDQMRTLRSDLAKELKLKKMMVDNFIPRKVQKKIEDRIRYDEIGDKYLLAPRTDLDFEQPPVNRKLINPYLNLTRYTNLSSVNNIYHSNENLLAVEPEPPVSNSQELVLEEEDSYMQTFIAETMRELTQELVIVCDHRKGFTHK